jgi:hypothetical protein
VEFENVSDLSEMLCGKSECYAEFVDSACAKCYGSFANSVWKILKSQRNPEFRRTPANCNRKISVDGQKTAGVRRLWELPMNRSVSMWKFKIGKHCEAKEDNGAKALFPVRNAYSHRILGQPMPSRAMKVEQVCSSPRKFVF